MEIEENESAKYDGKKKPTEKVTIESPEDSYGDDSPADLKKKESERQWREHANELQKNDPGNDTAF